jgi:hypothetical protein
MEKVIKKELTGRTYWLFGDLWVIMGVRQLKNVYYNSLTKEYRDSHCYQVLAGKIIESDEISKRITVDVFYWTDYKYQDEACYNGRTSYKSRRICAKKHPEFLVYQLGERIDLNAVNIRIIDSVDIYKKYLDSCATGVLALTQ